MVFQVMTTGVANTPPSVNVALPFVKQVALVKAGDLVWLLAMPETPKKTALGNGALVPAVVTFVKVIF